MKTRACKMILLALAAGLLSLISSPVRAAPTPTQQAYFKASNAGTRDEFGWSVAVSGGTAVIGAHYESSNATGVNGDQNNNNAPNSGAAYVFVRNGTNWIQQAYLKASNTGGGDQFGYSVATSGNTIVIGAPFEDSNATGVNGDQNNNTATSSGAAYVFVRDGTNWIQQAYLKASNTGGPSPGDSDGDTFGWSVAVSGDTLVVSAIGEDSNATGVNGNQGNNSAPNSGAVYVFVRNGTNWVQQAYLKASNTDAGDEFGNSVSVSGDTVVVGAINEGSNATGANGNQSNNSAPSSGAAYLFVRNGTNWTQQAYLKASNTGTGDNFGLAVAVSGDTLAVSAGGEDSNTTGIDGDQSNNGAFDAGAVYVFRRNGTNWSQQAYLKASNTGGPLPGEEYGDNFGAAVGVSGDTVVIGGFAEDSNGIGVYGNQTVRTAMDSGAAYVFTGFGAGTLLDLAPDGSGGYSIKFKGIPDLTYRLQRAPSVTGPWDTIATNTVPASGLIQHHETSPLPGAAFYRTVQP